VTPGNRWRHATPWPIGLAGSQRVLQAPGQEQNFSVGDIFIEEVRQAAVHLSARAEQGSDQEEIPLMTSAYPRDSIGYGSHAPDPK
jgi:hypothetical protein